MSPQAFTRGVATMVELPDGERFLLVEITIDCPVCGRHTIHVAGHHLRAIRDLMIEFMDLHPDLTGKDGDIQTIERLQIQGRGPDDPTKN